jgi:hypothetical protein
LDNAILSIDVNFDTSVIDFFNVSENLTLMGKSILTVKNFGSLDNLRLKMPFLNAQTIDDSAGSIVAEPTYTITRKGNILFLAIANTYGPWNLFVESYQDNEDSLNLTLPENIEAGRETKYAPLAFGQTMADNFIISGGAAERWANASNKADLSFVFENKQSITFSNIGLLNFRSSDNKGAAIKAQSSNIFFTGAIRLQSSPQSISDVDIDENSQIIFDNVDFVNGIRVSGEGQTIKTGGGAANFSGQASVIDGSFQVLGGTVNFNSAAKIKTLSIENAAVNFKSAVSSVASISLVENTVVSLINGNALGRLYSSATFNVPANNTLGFDVDFSNGQADRIVVYGLFEQTYTSFLINPVRKGNEIAILVHSKNIIDNNPTIYVTTDDYDIYGGGYFIFIRPNNAAYQSDIVNASNWQEFVNEYKYAPQVSNDWIKLSTNLNAAAGDQDIEDTKALVNFNIDGRHYTLNANAFALGFVFEKKNITFKDIGFKNFVGAVIEVSNESQITFAGDINFNFNAQTVSDVNLLDENSQVVFNDVNFVNGIRVLGAGQTIKTGAGAANFSGAKTVINGGLEVLGGEAVFNSAVVLERVNVDNAEVVFKSAYSSAAIIDASNDSTISLKNDLADSRLFVNELSLRGNLVLDVNFDRGFSDKIYTSSITIFSGSNLIINRSFSYELIVNEVPIIFADNFFGFNQRGSFTNSAANIFNYDTSLYSLRFDEGQKTLYIKNILPADQNSARTKNQKAVEDIVNANGYLKYPAVKMSPNKKRLGYDSLSGVFYANIFSAMLYENNENVFMQSKQAPNQTFWFNVDFSGLGFHNADQTIGDFKGEGFEIILGRDLRANDLTRLGVFIAADEKKFSQAQNKAKLQAIRGGLYGDLNFKGFNAKGVVSAAYGGGRVEREVYFDNIYNPKSNISMFSFSGAVDLDYMFLLQNKNGLRRFAGPFFEYELNQLSIFKSKESGGSTSNLYFDNQFAFRNAIKGGLEFRQQKNSFEFFVRAFAGQNLNGRQEFDMQILDLRHSFEVESDDENLLFYGGQAGMNLTIAQFMAVGAQGSMQANENFQGYNVGLNMSFKFTLGASTGGAAAPLRQRARRAPRSMIPTLEFVNGSNELTSRSRNELIRFAQNLEEDFPDFRRLTIFATVNNSNDDESVRANDITLERVEVIKRILLENRIPSRKIWDAARRITTRNRITLRVER